MDPLSITASAIAIIQLSSAIINSSYECRSRVKNASKDASRIISELNSLCDVIDTLFKLAESEFEAKLQQSPILSGLAKPDGPLKRCETTLTALQQKLEPQEGWRAKRASILWPMKDNDVKKVLLDIEGMKATIQLALAADQRFSGSRVCDLNACSPILARRATSAIHEGLVALTQQLSVTALGLALGCFYFVFMINLVNQQGSLSAAVENVFMVKGEGQQPPLLGDLFLVVRELVEERSDSVYFVIDALDECKQTDELLQVLKQLHDWGLSNFHILVTSRQLWEIQQSLEGIVTTIIPVIEFAIEGDILLYISERLKNDQKFAKWPEEIRKMIWQTLSNGARGMFRWVVCPFDTLGKCLTIGSLKTELSSLPRTLEEIYERILLPIDQSYRSNAFKILQWLALSARPVTVGEGSEMLAIELGERAGYNPDLKLLDPRDVMVMCFSLVTTRATSVYDLETLPAAYDEYNVYEQFDELRLAHMSVADYLLSSRIRSSGGDLQFQLKEQPLLHYAAHLWPYHVNAAGNTIEDETWRLVQQFFATKALKHGGNFAAWIVTLTPGVSLDIIKSTHPLYYAPSFGIASVVQKLLETDKFIDIEARGGRFGSPALQVACYRNHPKTVKILLEAGADPMSIQARQ
ncbi:hypothetical protein MMC30_005219 [Trapelia coarctata]|nr:hypothetical protein [Trapelia coarctata]